MQKRNNQAIIRTVVGIGIFAALAYVVMLVIHIPVYFLTFDAKDAVITVAGFIYGPLASVGISLAVALVEMISVSGTGIYGFIMNFLSSAAFSGVAALLYRLIHSGKGAVISLVTSIVSTTGVMLLLNLWITPLYLGVPAQAVREMLVPVLLPFNFAKACLNASITILIYKPVVTAMRHAGLVSKRVVTQTDGGTAQKRKLLSFNRFSAFIIALAAVLAAVAITLFVIVNNQG